MPPLNKCNHCRQAYPFVYKSIIVSFLRKAGAAVLIQATGLSKFSPILYSIETNCAWRGPSETSALSHTSCSCAFPAECFARIITPLCSIVGTLSSRTGTFYSPALVSDILTRSHKTCHRREERRQMPESLDSLTKKSKRPLRLSWSHTIMSLHTHPPTHTLMHAGHMSFVTM